MVDVKNSYYRAPQGWERVSTLKLGNDGIYLTDPKTKLFSQKDYTVNPKTGDLYWNDSPAAVAEKCFRIILGTPFYILGIMGWNFSKAFIDPTRMGVANVAQFGEDLKSKPTLDAMRSLVYRTVVEVPKTAAAAIGADLWDVVRAPFYGIAMIFSAAYGLYDPYVGREYEGRVEHALMHNVSHKEDFRRKKREAIDECMPELIYGIQNAQAFYLAYCFQVMGNVNDPRLSIRNREPV